MPLKGVSLSSVRKANQNMIEGKKTDASTLPKGIQEDILKRHYSAEEINKAYAHTLKRG